MGNIIDALQGGLTILVGLIFVAFLIGLIVAIPFLLIWCLNTLGVASASYGLMEWIAAFFLTAFFFGG